MILDLFFKPETQITVYSTFKIRAIELSLGIIFVHVKVVHCLSSNDGWDRLSTLREKKKKDQIALLIIYKNASFLDTLSELHAVNGQACQL